MLQLYGSGASPFVRKARVLMAEAGIDDVDYVEVSASPMGGEDRVNTANPLGKIPSLVRDNGPTIYDSNVICRFLDDHSGGLFYPQARLWEVLTLEATADGIMEAAVGVIYEKRFRPEALQWPEWHEAQWVKVERALDAIERSWLSHLEGPVHMGQIAVACALGLPRPALPRPRLARRASGFDSVGRYLRAAPLHDIDGPANRMKIVIAADDASRQACFDIRRRVFIEEQEIPEAEEWDDADATCTHFLALSGDSPAATARLIAKGDTAKIGRVAVLPAHRGTGLGRDLMLHILDHSRTGGFTKSVIEAQVTVIPFYERLGYVAEGDAYDDGSGILHRVMRLAFA
jgi:glutathione S-transferase